MIDKFKWYAVHTMAQSELKVKTLIENTKNKYNISNLISEVIIPTEVETKKIEGKKIVKHKKVFPGYVLVKMVLTDDTFSFIRRTPGITNFVQSGGKPVPLKDHEVKEILDALDPNKGFSPKQKWAKDMIVRISDGPFSDFTGKIDFVNNDKETLTISISLFGRDTPVEIEFGKVEKLS